MKASKIFLTLIPTILVLSVSQVQARKVWTPKPSKELKLDRLKSRLTRRR